MIDIAGNATRVLGLVLVWLAASVSSSVATASPNTVIDLTYDALMDMVRPEVHPGIVVHHNLQITVTGSGNLAEARNRSAGPYQDQNSMVQVLG
jgi:hypothetical protein